MLSGHLQQARQKRQAAGLERKPRVPPAEGVDFSSNDYLGLRRDPGLKRVLEQAVRNSGCGSGSAHLVSGHSAAHARFEQALAQWLGYEACLLLPSGYQANLALLSGLLPAGAPVLQDKLAHASLIDGARLGRLRLRRFRHNDVEHARRFIHRQRPWLLSTEGVFSMDGDRAPLMELAAICRQADCWLHVDDAHGLGVLGPEGRGSVAAAGLNHSTVPLLTVTFGKAMGLSGAAVLAGREVIEHLHNHARPWIYSTATPPAWAEAGLHALEQIRGPERRRLLWRNIEQFRQLAQAHELPLASPAGPIQILPAPDVATCSAWGRCLEAQGWRVGVIRPPTSPTPRLRITLTAAHRPEQIQGLVLALSRLRSRA